MRLSLIGAGLFFSSLFALAGALVACASGSSSGNSMGPPSGSSGGGHDASVQDSGSSDDAPSAVYADSNPGVDVPQGMPTDDGSAEAGEDGSADAGDGGGVDAGVDAPAVGLTCTPGQTCVDAVPMGWTGYVQLLLQNGDAGAACAAPYGTPETQLSGQTNPDGGPAACAACTCGVPDSGPITCSMNLTTGLCPSFGAPINVGQGSCVANPFLFSANGAGAAPTVAADAGPCGPGQGGGVATPPPPPTSTIATVCGSQAANDAAAPDAGASDAVAPCMLSQACAAVPQTQPDGGSPSGPCIYQAGVQDCPVGGAFTVQYVIGALSDDRGCSCTCGLATCPSDGYVEGYANANCTGTVSTTITSSSVCAAAAPTAMAFKFFASHSAWAGACVPDDAGPTGSVTVDGGTATTFCCMP